MPPSPKRHEAAFNQAFGEALLRRNPQWKSLHAEVTGVLENGRKRPDLLFDQGRGRPVAIETEYEPASTVEQDARSRIDMKVLKSGAKLEQAIAVRIPAKLQSVQSVPLENLNLEIANAAFEFALLTKTETGTERFPAKGWSKGGLDQIARTIELSSLSEGIIRESLQIMERKVGQAANLVEDVQGITSRIAKVLMQEDDPETRLQTLRMAMAILANAMVFHGVLHNSEHEVQPISRLTNSAGDPSNSKIIAEWDRILCINYWPIFHLAKEILQSIDMKTSTEVLKRLIEAANDLSEIGITTTHDLLGRVFQRLVSDRKFLATYYTLPESALLLAELATARLNIDWTDMDACKKLRIADFACGTGTLLSAAYQSMTARMRHAHLNDFELHPHMMENALYGADIMPAATHLTTSQLASSHPATTFKDTKIYTMPYGMDPEGRRAKPDLGSLNFIEDRRQRTLFPTGIEQIHGETNAEEAPDADIQEGSINLVIMNPPFTRPTNKEAGKKGIPVPSFAGFGTSKEEQRKMSQRLAKMMKKLDRPAGHGNAGLASNFIDLADRMLCDDGCVALVLPVTFAGGSGWKSARELLARNYQNHLVISIAATGAKDRAFSADTGMAECLVVATRSYEEENGKNQALFVNLLRRPRSLVEASQVAHAIETIPPDSLNGEIPLGEQHIGHYLRGSLLEDGRCVQILNVGVVESCRGLAEGQLYLPRIGPVGDLPITRLGGLGTRGPYHLDISGPLPRGPFDIVEKRSVSEFPVLQKHNAARERTLVVEPDTQGTIRKGQEERARRMWAEHATRLHFNLDFQVNSQSLAACVTPEATLGGTAWPGCRLHDSAHEAPILLWANSTLGIMSFWWQGTRQQEGRSRLGISSLPDLPALDARKLTDSQMEKCAKLFEGFSRREFRPAHEACRDPVRIALDEELLVEVLGLSRDLLEPLSVLREQWCDEPTVHGGKGRKNRNR